MGTQFSIVSIQILHTIPVHKISIYQSLLGAFFSEIKQPWAPFLPRFSGILPRFSEVLPKFSGILPKFSTNQNFWGWVFTPCTPASYTLLTIIANVAIATGVALLGAPRSFVSNFL